MFLQNALFKIKEKELENKYLLKIQEKKIEWDRYNHEITAKFNYDRYLLEAEIDKLKIEKENIETEKVLSLKKEVEELSKNLAVTKKENELLKQALDTEAKLIDVKDLVSELINKLPEFKIDTLSVSTNYKHKNHDDN